MAREIWKPFTIDKYIESLFDVEFLDLCEQLLFIVLSPVRSVHSIAKYLSAPLSFPPSPSLLYKKNYEYYNQGFRLKKV
jgi:hypothetical protein